MACDDHLQNCLYSNVSRQVYQDAKTIAGSGLTTDSYLEKAGLTRKINKSEDVYTSGRWKEEDLYEVLKVKKVIRNHIFKHVKFCKGEGVKFMSNNLEWKNKKIIELSKSYEKVDLSKSIEYQYNVIK